MYVRKLFVITTAVKKWCQYLLGHRFTILTDHCSLKELLTQVIHVGQLASEILRKRVELRFH